MDFVCRSPGPVKSPSACVRGRGAEPAASAAWQPEDLLCSLGSSHADFSLPHILKLLLVFQPCSWLHFSHRCSAPSRMGVGQASALITWQLATAVCFPQAGSQGREAALSSR